MILGGAGLDRPNPDIQPSVVIHEKHGVISVLLVPVQPGAPDEFAVTERREASIWRAIRVSERQLTDRLLNRKASESEDPEDQPGSPPAVTLAKFPLFAVMGIEQAPEGALGLDDFMKAFDGLRKQSGLEQVERDALDVSSWSTWRNEYVDFSFMNFDD